MQGIKILDGAKNCSYSLSALLFFGVDVLPVAFFFVFLVI